MRVLNKLAFDIKEEILSASSFENVECMFTPVKDGRSVYMNLCIEGYDSSVYLEDSDLKKLFEAEDQKEVREKLLLLCIDKMYKNTFFIENSWIPLELDLIRDLYRKGE